MRYSEQVALWPDIDNLKEQAKAALSTADYDVEDDVVAMMLVGGKVSNLKMCTTKRLLVL